MNQGKKTCFTQRMYVLSNIESRYARQLLPATSKKACPLSTYNNSLRFETKAGDMQYGLRTFCYRKPKWTLLSWGKSTRDTEIICMQCSPRDAIMDQVVPHLANGPPRSNVDPGASGSQPAPAGPNGRLYFRPSGDSTYQDRLQMLIRRVEKVTEGEGDPLLQGNARALRERTQVLGQQFYAWKAVEEQLRISQQALDRLHRTWQTTEMLLEAAAKDAEQNLRRHQDGVPSLRQAVPDHELRNVEMWPQQGQWKDTGGATKIKVRNFSTGGAEEFPLPFSTHYPNCRYVRASHAFSLRGGKTCRHKLNINFEMQDAVAPQLVSVPWHRDNYGCAQVITQSFVGRTPEDGLHILVYNAGKETLHVEKGEIIALFYFVKMEPVQIEVINNNSTDEEVEEEEEEEEEPDDPYDPEGFPEDSSTESGSDEEGARPATPPPDTPPTSAPSYPAVTNGGGLVLRGGKQPLQLGRGG